MLSEHQSYNPRWVWEGPLARRTALLFWRLPEPFHTALSKVTGGWRVVVWAKNEVGVIDDVCWERWPEDVPIRYVRGK